MNISNKHIVILTPGFPISESDTTVIPALQVYVRNLIEKRTDISLTIVTFQYPFTSKKYTWHGIQVIPLNGQNNRIRKILIWQKAFKELKLLYKKKNLTHLHSFWLGECSYIGELFAKKHRCRHIITAMGQEARQSNLWATLLRKSNSLFVSLSENHQKMLNENCNIDSIIVPWGVETVNEAFTTKREIDILGVGSLNKVKNYKTFIRVISEVHHKTSSLKVEILGDGCLRNTLENQIQHAGLENVITLKGKIPRSEVLKKMAGSKILLHTSDYESFGFVFAEAVASGMHIVSFDVGIANSQLPQWTICENSTEMIETLLQKLSLSNNYESMEYLKVEDTVHQYIELYGF